RLTREEAIRLAAQATRRYAKRQETWFRKERGAVHVPWPYEELFASLTQGNGP
ncbi:MAG: hypothetical protein L0Y66_23175, partial [Myxococcaceae bacterium]|nr:hypothetical protein [Myxococcaceae bacterium]